MDWNDAATLARTLMNEHGLELVPFQFNNRKRSAGTTFFQYGKVLRIELSRPVVDPNPLELVRDTILHEIAHALVGHAAGHSWVWKLKAREIGANTERCCGDNIVTPPGKYQATCSCKIGVHHVHRMPKRRLVCRFTRLPLNFQKVR